jgi:hypothetical protein
VRIAHSSPDRLVLGQRPWFIPLLCLGMSAGIAWNIVRWNNDLTLFRWAVVAISASATLAMAWISADRVEMTLDRTTNEFRWSRRFGLGLRLRRGVAPLTDVERAIIDTHDAGDGVTWRVVLLVDGERIQLSDTYDAREDVNHRLADTINDWLARPAAMS